MGLDITAYEELADYLGPYTEELQNQLERHWMDYSNDPDYQDYAFVGNRDFPDRLDGLQEGYYLTEGDSFGFRAGAYSAYGRWRDQLARLAWGCGPTYRVERGDFIGADLSPYHGREFFELVVMSDCEGTIGPQTCAKLARDFAEHEQRIEALSAGDDDLYHDNGFMEKYREFRQAFELAAGKGCVRYH